MTKTINCSRRLVSQWLAQIDVKELNHQDLSFLENTQYLVVASLKGDT